MPRPLILPTFWDLHIHGVAGRDFMAVDSFDEIIHCCEKLGENGIGFFAPTLLTSSYPLLEKACKTWGDFLKKWVNPKTWPKNWAYPVGLHLEGPFLNPEMAGAHPKSSLKKPSIKTFERLEKASSGKIAIVTLAPEMPGALALIAKLNRQKIRVQLGHSMATRKEALKAVKSGAHGITHLFNAMKVHHREPGLLSLLYSQDLKITSEIITDGKHIDPSFLAHQCKSLPGRLYAVSDGCACSLLKDGAVARLGDVKIKKQGTVAVTVPHGTLAGAATVLTSHPATLKPFFKGSEKELWKLFYNEQVHMFSRLKKEIPRPNNRFDPKTFRFLGVL